MFGSQRTLVLVSCFAICRLLNIEDLQNAELWQQAGLLTIDQAPGEAQHDSKQAIAGQQQPQQQTF